MLPSDIRAKRILLSPLNWGMGHVARCIPLIDLFLKNDNTVFVAGDQIQLNILKQYCPEIIELKHDGYPFEFAEHTDFRYSLLKQLPQLTQRWKRERNEVERFCIDYNMDLVISDHRYGFRSNSTHSIFLTHQVHLPLRWYEGLAQRLHSNWIRRFNEVWIADDKQLNYAGKLSRSDKTLLTTHVGILSRFQLYPERTNPSGGTVIIVSGPKAFAMKFAREQERFFANQEVTMIISTELSELKFESNIKIIPASDWKYCDQLILNASKIVSRSGYSTLMDLVHLKIPFSITPTPGQSEQEYLFNYWRERMKE